MTDEQTRACRELIRVAQVASMTARGLWYYATDGSQAETVLRDIELRLYEACEVANAALNAKSADGVTDATVH